MPEAHVVPSDNKHMCHSVLSMALSTLHRATHLILITPILQVSVWKSMECKHLDQDGSVTYLSLFMKNNQDSE